MRRPLFLLVTAAILLGPAARAHADLTLFVGTNTAQDNRPVRGFSAGLKGLRDVKAPPSWAATYAKLYGTPLATRIAQILGDTGAAAAMLATLDNAKAKSADRQTALRGLASQLSLIHI